MQRSDELGRALTEEPDPRAQWSLASAERAVSLASADPKAALRLATQLIYADVGVEASVVARRAASLAHVALGRPEQARTLLEEAERLAGTSGMRGRLSEVRRSLAFTLLQMSEPERALRAISQAVAESPDSENEGAARAQRAMILMRLGRYADALEESKAALRMLRRGGMATQEAYLRTNRGISYAYLGELDLAEKELGRALRLHRREGSELSAVQVVHNLGFVAARRGDVPAALRHYGESISSYEALGVPTDRLLVDRCEVLVAARLLPEARADAEKAVRGLEGGGSGADLAEARLMLARVALVQGDERTASVQANAAAEAFARQQRSGWEVLARFFALGTAGAGGLAGARALASELENWGWHSQALETRISFARTALSKGDAPAAQGILGSLDPPRLRPAAEERVRAWYAEALIRRSRNDRPGALRALQIGLRVAEDHQASLGASELRARAATGAADLAALGLEMSLERRSARSVLLWAERFRSRSLARPRVLPPTDPALARSLSDLRQVVAELERTRLEGGNTRELERQRRSLEATVRLRSLGVAAADIGAGPSPAATPRRLQEALGDRLLLELVSWRGELYGIVCTSGACALVSLGPSAAVERQRAVLQLALGRLAYRRSAAASLLAAAQLLRRSAAALDALLLAPIARVLGGPEWGGALGEVVIVPTGSLHGIPWALLPSLGGRPVSVAPSAGLWLQRRDGSLARGTAGRVLLAAGPDVATAPQEMQDLRVLHHEATVLEGASATVEGVLSALESADLAHVVAHGTFRADNALFSALRFHDGLLTVYDLESVATPPTTVVLSACDAGRAQVQVGDELMGTSAALLAMGTDTIVASVAPVPDSGTREVMGSLHEGLLLGVSTASALARTHGRYALLSLSDDEIAAGSESAQKAQAAAAFVCFGGGPVSPSRHRTAKI